MPAPAPRAARAESGTAAPPQRLSSAWLNSVMTRPANGAPHPVDRSGLLAHRRRISAPWKGAVNAAGL
jgi:hypothetical protein